MHFDFHLHAVQILWALAFAGHLVLLVVLLGRDRAKRFPWFTASISLAALRLVTSKLLTARLPQLTMAEIFLPLAVISMVVSLLVLVELVRHAFRRVHRRTLLIWVLGATLIAGVVAGSWGPWPSSWKSITPDSTMALLRLLQLVAQKLSLMVDVLTICLGMLMVLFGRRFGAGWRSHTQQITIGLSTASLSQIGVQVIWQLIARSAAPHSMAEYQHIIGLRDKLLNANSAVFVVVLIWWIVCLWIDEPGTANAEPTKAEPAEPEAAAG
jgi:hypothetical protein